MSATDSYSSKQAGVARFLVSYYLRFLGVMFLAVIGSRRAND
jgi:hypothetical protein